MAIKKYYVDQPKDGYKYDRKEKRYFSWGFDIRLCNTRRQERGFFTKSEAEAAVVKLKQEAKQFRHGIDPDTKPPLLFDLFQKKLHSMTEDPKDRKRAKVIFNYFLRLLRNDITIIEIKTAHLKEYVNARLADKNQRSGGSISAQTILRELAPIMAALNAAGEFFIEMDGYRAPKKPKLKIPQDVKDRVISLVEQKKILEYLLEPRRDNEDRRTFEIRRRTGHYLQFSLLTLSRPGEVAKLKCIDVDLEAGIVSITGSKTRYKSRQLIRKLKITALLQDILIERLRAATGDYVFTTGGVVTPKMYAQMKAACEAHGIRYGRDDKLAISFQTTRHTGITRLLRKNVDLKTIGKMSGHSDGRMTMRYSHTNTDLTDAASDYLEADLK